MSELVNDIKNGFKFDKTNVNAGFRTTGYTDEIDTHIFLKYNAKNELLHIVFLLPSNKVRDLESKILMKSTTKLIEGRKFYFTQNLIYEFSIDENVGMITIIE